MFAGELPEFIVKGAFTSREVAASVSLTGLLKVTVEPSSTTEAAEPKEIVSLYVWVADVLIVDVFIVTAPVVCKDERTDAGAAAFTSSLKVIVPEPPPLVELRTRVPPP